MRIKKKEEAGNRGVVCRRSGFCHGEVSNTDCLFVVVVVGFEAHTVCASTPFFASRRFSLFWKRFSSRSSKTFSGFVRFRRCARRRLFFTRKNRKEKIYREREIEKVTARTVSVWTRTCTRVRVSVYTLTTVLVCACVHARGSQTLGWLLENTCFRSVRVSLRIHYHQHTGGHYKCPARPHGATDTSTFYHSEYWFSQCCWGRLVISSQVSDWTLELFANISAKELKAQTNAAKETGIFTIPAELLRSFLIITRQILDNERQSAGLHWLHLF